MIKNILIATAAAIAFAAMLHQGTPMFFKNRISGRLIDAVYVPNASGSGTLCILTDGSWSYFSRFQSAGKQFSGEKGIFCKTHLYRYDPVNEKVLGRTTASYDQLPPSAVLLHKGETLWEISTEPDRRPLRVLAFDPQNGRQLMDTSQFYARFAGPDTSIQRQTLHPFLPSCLTLTTEDNRNIVIDLDSGEHDAALEHLLAHQKGKINRFALADPELGGRRRLWRLSGGDWRLCEFDIPQSAFKDLSYFERQFDATAVALSPALHFRDGVLIYQDDDRAVILHQEEMASPSDRRLTCVDTSGRIKWTLPQTQLFPGLALRQDNPFSSALSIQNRLRIKTSGTVMLIVFQPEGWLGIDAENGRELWRHTF